MTTQNHEESAMAREWDDPEREEGLITDVSDGGREYYSVTSSNGWSCGVSREHGVEPKVGDHFTTWGRIGFPIRGQAINRRVLYYRTADEQRVEDQRALERAKAERIAEYESKRNEFDARVAALPSLLRERLEGFRAFGGDAWRWEMESYELMCCEQAAALVARFPTTDALAAFIAIDDHGGQKRAFPDMDSGHSGNSWGFTQHLARAVLEVPNLVPQIHGALCPLVGCETACCYAARGAAAQTT